ncbi:ISKra4 family transposase [Allomesorhizobium camelthorni]|uniref:ISKra4 family transposase n=1 Tax=Allomesorhizobium camelthorni TaxID=475069 RepID=A0A6G4WMW5_9HYPH|nr:ISKra4 family transposase [Mesorhizobium camelthorni]NGO55440.1 ISKra4 family transposase [Mesorhizobium camelthorni]
MRFAIQLVTDVGDATFETREIVSIDKPDGVLSIDDLGLTLGEAKAMLATLQVAITETQALDFARYHRSCPSCRRPRRLKDKRMITVRTCLGKLALPSPRYGRCRCQAVPSVIAPVVAALPERVTPDLIALEARWASLAAYGVTAALLADMLPIGETVNASTIRNDVMRVAKRLEAELGPEQAMFASGCQAEWNEMPIPGPPVTIGIDGGYVRSWTDWPANFEVIVGKSLPEEGPVRRFGFVTGHDEKPKRRLHELLVSQGITMNQEVTFMSDGGDSVRDLQLYMRPNADHVLDYFHIAMRITVLQQMARGLPPPVSAAAPAIIEALQSVRRYLWHGNFSRALSLVEDLDDGLDLLDDPPPEVRKLRRYLGEFSGYITNNAGFIPNYAERHRYGEAVSTAFVESTVNQVIAKRFAKKQQMQWTPRGVHLLMQLRTRVLDGILDSDFKRWRNERRSPPNEAKMAA